MEYADTYVPIFRSLLNHRYMADSVKLHFWVWCLLKAAHTPYKQLVGNQTVSLGIGQFVFGRKAAAKETGISEQTIRTLLNFFSSLDEQKLTIKSTNKYSVITVIDYGTYMDKVKQPNRQTNQHLTSNQPATNHKQEGKEGKEGKELKASKRTESENKIILCFAERYDWLSKNYPGIDLVIEKERICEKYRDGPILDTFLLITTWMNNEKGKRGTNGTGNNSSTGQSGTKKTGEQNPVIIKGKGDFACGFPDNSDKW